MESASLRIFSSLSSLGSGNVLYYTLPFNKPLNMGKTKIRAIIILTSVILFGGTYFAVLATEESKRLAKNSDNREQFMNNVRDLDQARKLYLESVLQSRNVSKQEMSKAREQYEKLLKDQPSLVQQNQKQTTTKIEQLVPVADSSNVSATQTTKPKSTRTTKTS
jgi:ElaB/YqjD/DUF883 family membrane-anchored ribosome-binding protein